MNYEFEAIDRVNYSQFKVYGKFISLQDKNFIMNITRVIRVIHRDLGFLMVGISLVYGISGILLNHLKGKDPAIRTEAKTVQFPANLSESELLAAWQADKSLPAVNTVKRIEAGRSRLFLDGGLGVYDSSKGSIDYQIHKKRPLIYWINRLHYNKVKGWWPVADIFAGSLILLAITGLFMVKGKRGLAGSGKWYLLAGILIPIIFGLFFL